MANTPLSRESRVQRQFLHLILVMVVVALAVGGITISFLYRAAFEEERARLVETAQSQARLIEAVARFDARNSRADHPEGAAAATLSQVRDAHKNYRGFGETGEFTLARRQGDKMVFLLRHRHSDLDTPRPVPWNSKIADPMRRALTGLSGTVVGLDYRGVMVLAAHEPVAELNLGIVAKIDLAEVRAPFIKAGYTSGAGAIVIIILGVVLFRRVSAPIIERENAEQALRESEAQLRLVTDNIPLQVAYIDRDFRVRFANRPYSEWHGISQDDVIGTHVRDLLGNEAFEKYLPYLTRALAGEVTSSEEERRLADGGLRYFRITRVPHFGDDGEIQGYFVIVVDLTEHHEREAVLHHAQKMEALGQLTGGVAHDFNNLLTVVTGNLEMLRDKLPDDDLRDLAQSSLNSAFRGAELTQQLLSFSRKQTLAPRVIDLNEQVVSMSGLMDRTLGETIEIEMKAGDDVWNCEVDPGQLENAILNLALNARDAMPDGGTLTIETANVKLDDTDVAARNDVSPGDYVRVSVSDTGTGMSRDVADHAFDPFFTTKEVGTGSGLGLSMVHGFINQSDGFVTIDSTEGIGTTVKLYLPRTFGTLAPVRPIPEGKDPLSLSGKVLVVEDHPEVRALTVDMLTGLGYDTVEAADGKEAIALLQQTPGIDLLFADVVLPGGMSGVDIAKEAARLYPDIKILFATGYADDFLARYGEIDANVELVHKPFRKSELAQKLRAAMG